MERAAAPPPARPAEWWLEVGELLRRGDGCLVRGPRAAALRQEWQEVADKERRLDDRLFIGLVGGTGVGKSTLINAIAGETVSRSGDRRPTTERVVVYRHAGRTLPPSLPKQDLESPEHTHPVAALEPFLFLDFPDFDSVETNHAAILNRYLPHLDLAFVILDETKYGDRVLFEVLRALPQSPENLYFILNKTDRLERRYREGFRQVVADILEDFRRKVEHYAGWPVEGHRLLALSAREAFLLRSEDRGARDDGRGPPEFRRLLDLLEEYLSQKHRLAVKELNLEHLKEELAGKVRAAFLDALPADLAARARRRLAEGEAESEKILLAVPVEVLGGRERGALRAATLRRLRPRLGFPVDLVFTPLLEWKGRKAGERRSPRAALADRIRAHYAAAGQALEVFERGYGEEFGEAMAGRSARQDGPAPRGRAAIDWGLQLDGEIAGRVERLLRWRRFRNHALPAAALLVFLWALLHPAALALVRLLLGEEKSSWSEVLRQGLISLVGGLSPGFIFSLLFTLLFLYGLGALYLWVRLAQAVEDAIAAVESRARDEVRRAASERFRRLRQELEDWEREKARLEELVSGAGG